METERIVAGKLDGEHLDRFDRLKDDLSFNGSIKISEASVIKWLLEFYYTKK